MGICNENEEKQQQKWRNDIFSSAKCLSTIEIVFEILYKSHIQKSVAVFSICQTTSKMSKDDKLQASGKKIYYVYIY